MIKSNSGYLSQDMLALFLQNCIAHTKQGFKLP